jgi:hypothetical protein
MDVPLTLLQVSYKENFYKFLNASYKTAKKTYTVENWWSSWPCIYKKICKISEKWLYIYVS